MIAFSGLDMNLPKSWPQFKHFAEHANAGETVSLYKVKVTSGIIGAFLEEAVWEIVNNESLKEKINSNEKENARFWEEYYSKNFERDEIEIKLITVFTFLGGLCDQATKDMIFSTFTDPSDAFESALALFREITEGRYGDFGVRRVTTGWLKFHTTPLSSTDFIYDEKKKILWLLFSNNWNF